MEVIFSTETSVDFHWLTLLHIPEDRILQNQGQSHIKNWADKCEIILGTKDVQNKPK
jgi:hypothetical protein